MSEFRIDALLPAEMARRAEYVGVSKAEAPKLKTFALAILAGAFISMGAVFATTVAADASGQLTYGVTKLLVGLVFCLGLMMAWLLSKLRISKPLARSSTSIFSRYQV